MATCGRGGEAASHSEAGLEAVEGRRPVGRVLVPPLAEEQRVLVQEEVPLHGLEPGQLLHAHCCPLVADPHAEAPLKNHPTQLAEVSLRVTRRKVILLAPPTSQGAAVMLLPPDIL